jgi:2-oxoglutarate dehydrogenase E1 component
MDRLSYVSNAENGYIDSLYAAYRQDPQSVDASWQRFFEGFEFAAQFAGAGPSSVSGAPASSQLQKEIAVVNLIQSYRSRGHLFADLNPILPRREFQPNLDIKHFGLSEADLDTRFEAGAEMGLPGAKLRDIVQHLEDTYCRTIGVEYKYIRIPEVLRWFESRMEPTKNRPNLNKETKTYILRKLAQATLFERFIQKKFTGQKRFSLEGGEALIPALDNVIQYGAHLGIKDFVLGMAHRGRLSVLTNVMQKEVDHVLGEFADRNMADDVFDGDVKYHLGYSRDIVLDDGGTTHVSLLPNPSHLETVDPVVVGNARARMDLNHGGNHDRVCPILIHGDAAVAGQGVVYELIQMSRLPGYEVGGTIHIVINNQVGFTTDPSDARSSTYCTDVGKTTLSPVFHVNGDDPEAVFQATQMAMDFRQAFSRDVFIDIICYRKYGHNEGDEPRFTQPKMYAAIDKHPSPFEVYRNKVLAEGSLTQAEVDAIVDEINAHLDDEFEQSKTSEWKFDTDLKGRWEGIRFYNDKELEPNPITQVKGDTLRQLAQRLTVLPEGFTPHRNIKRLLEQRAQMVVDDAIDWGMAETLAYATLLAEGNPVRMTGQDVIRGTFSHRHAGITDIQTEQKYFPLNHLQDGQAKLDIYNSLLSEYAVMGFEYGYAWAAPHTLTIWEAQFGDFVNGAQIILDQYLTASKTKWQRLNGLVLLLPHGYEGQGPEHSSARMERFLTLCAQKNMYVCNITTPANLFHALRRQVKADSRRPLVVFTPKSLLRHPKVVSSLSEFTDGKFQELIDDTVVAPKNVKRVVFCSGKLYYDLLAQRETADKYDTALVRLEQLYPLPEPEIKAVLAKYSGAQDIIWAQEEPINMGAWTLMLRKLQPLMPAGIALECISRRSSASPATGSGGQHRSQQDYILKKALNLAPELELAKA